MEPYSWFIDGCWNHSLTRWNQALDTQRWITNRFSHNNNKTKKLFAKAHFYECNKLSVWKQEFLCLIHDFCCISIFLCYSQISVFGSVSKNNIYQILLFFGIHVMYLLIDILDINDKQTHSDQHQPLLTLNNKILFNMLLNIFIIIILFNIL